MIVNIKENNMNEQKLKYLESAFLSQYKNGFNDEELQKVGKKHNLKKRTENIHNVCSEEALNQGLANYENVVKVVGTSSLVSVFEKMRFRDLSKELDDLEKHMFLDAVYELIHGDEEIGFQMMYDLLSPYKLAKWPIITIFRAYYYPHNDIFVKPTTVKKIISYLELEDIHYTPKVNYDFYKKYRIYFNQMKDLVENETLKPNNPAFSGFLWMSIN